MTKIPWGAPRTVLKESAGMIFSCWRPTFRERLQILLTGRVYVQSDSLHARPLANVDALESEGHSQMTAAR